MSCSAQAPASTASRLHASRDDRVTSSFERGDPNLFWMILIKTVILQRLIHTDTQRKERFNVLLECVITMDEIYGCTYVLTQFCTLVDVSRAELDKQIS